MDYDGLDAGMDLGTESFSDMGFADAGFNGGPGAGGMGGFGMDALLSAIAFQMGGFEIEDEVIVTGDRHTDDGPSYMTHEFWSNFFSEGFDALMQQIQDMQQADGPEDNPFDENGQRELENGIIEEQMIFDELGFEIDVDDDSDNGMEFLERMFEDHMNGGAENGPYQVEYNQETDRFHYTRIDYS